jgi:hypothetical protein
MPPKILRISLKKKPNSLLAFVFFIREGDMRLEVPFGFGKLHDSRQGVVRVTESITSQDVSQKF